MTSEQQTVPQSVTEASDASPRWLGLYAFEIVSWTGLLIGVVFLRAHGLRIDWQTVRYTIPPLIPATARAFLIGVVIYAVYTALRRRSVLDYLRQITRRQWLGLALRLWIVSLVFTYTYFWVKVCVPLVNERLLDSSLWKLDRLLHGGLSPSVFLVELFQGSSLTPWLDVWYGWWLPSITYAIGFFCAYPSAAVRRRVMTSCALIWTLGCWTYTAFPAVGPIYIDSTLWEEIQVELPRASSAQEMLWDNYRTVVAGRSGTLTRFNPTRGVAAMPSLHVGAHWLFMLWMWRYARPLFVPAVIGTFLTFLGSIVTGWHYAIDGYVGVLLAQLSYWAALWLDGERRRGKQDPDQSPSTPASVLPSVPQDQ
jgi:hypothetical protein